MSELVSIEAEMAVIGAVLVNPDAIAGLVDALPEDAFGDARSRAVYRAMRRLWERRVPPDFATVPAELLAMGGKDKGAALDFLTACRTQEQSWFYAEHYADQVRRLAWLRSIEGGALGLVKAIHGAGDGFDLDAALLSIRRDADRFSGRALASPAAFDAVDAIREETLRRWSGELQERIVPTGIRMLDRVFLGGFRPDDLIVIAARPSIGKTAFALHLAKRHRALVCSLEMPVKAVWHRLIATEAGVPYELANTAVGDLMQRSEWLEASDRVASWPLIVRDDLRTTSAIEAEIDRLQREGQGVDLVVIDHLGWLADTFRAGTSQYDRVSALSRRCAEAMKRTGVPFVLLSQLNREVEHRPGCVPYLSDLRDSGRVEEDATGIVLLYRRAYYSARNMGGLKPDPDDYIAGHAALDRMTLSVVKNRNGMTTTVDCGWHGRTMKVVDVEELAA